MGLHVDEMTPQGEAATWQGQMEVDLGPGRLREDLDVKKSMVWIFRVTR